MRHLNVGEVIALIVALLFAAEGLWLIYKGWKERLIYRESVVNETIQRGIVENPMIGTNDGFIFCSVWRLSHIRARAEELGVVLDTVDLYKIIGRMKRDFNPNYGINLFQIDMAIKHYVAAKKRDEYVSASSFIPDHLQVN